MILIDGSHGEGGGQILRSALTLAILTGSGFRIERIRARRRAPGLRPQHLACVEAAASISGAETRGAAIGSRELEFLPKRVRPGDYRFSIGSAGSTGLVFQTILLPLLMAHGPSTVEIEGGTHVPWSPCFHYLKEVYRPALLAMGGDFDLFLRRWGFYPKGGGILEARIRPSGLGAPFRPPLKGPYSVRCVSAVAMLPSHVASRQANALCGVLRGRGIEPAMEYEDATAKCPGSMVFVWTESRAYFGGFTSLGEKGKPAELVGKEAAHDLIAFLDSGANVDSRLSDQLILPALVSSGTSTWTTERVTRHLKTNLWLAKQFGFKNIEIGQFESGPARISVSGENLKK